MIHELTPSLFYDGKYQEALNPSNTSDVINPANGERLARLALATKEDLNRAVKAAEKGQKQWAAFTGFERARILQRAVALLRERNEELAQLESLNTGKPLSETTAVDIHTGADVLEYYAGLAPAIEGRQLPLRSTSFVYTRQVPLGVIGAIGAWNYPIQIALWKSAPALAAGNSMVYKPSEVTPLTTLKLAEIYHEAGLPNGVFNVLHGGGHELGVGMTEHPNIHKISFTGGSNTGKKVIASASGSTLKPTTVELGGKSPLIILPDANLDKAADIAMMANFYSSGQVCTNGTRVFIPKSLQEEFQIKVLERVKKGIRIGNPLDPKTNFGPLVSLSHKDSVLNYVQSALDQGAKLLYGGKTPPGDLFAKGAYMEPTVFTDCQDHMTFVQEEIFGPVMAILSYDHIEEVIERANASLYGLAAGVVSDNISLAHKVIQRIESGICWVNTWGESPPEMPVGGFKMSGLGRENGIETLYAYTQTQSIQVELDDFQSVF